MYNNEDLDYAVEKNIFSQDAVASFRKTIAGQRQTTIADEESFKLISGFNDIFIVIACLLLLSSCWFIASAQHPLLGGALVAIVSWFLAEFFIRKRKMALPAIVLLISFTSGVFSFGWSLPTPHLSWQYLLATSLALIATYLHWRRFKVPITVAAGAIALAGIVLSFIMLVLPSAKHYVLWLLSLFGVCVFAYAVYWDSLDRRRVSHHSDVAFWLHLLSAPLMIHPVFSSLGILDGNGEVFSVLAVLVLYILLSIMSIIVDRRAMMVSALMYVVVALSNLLTAQSAPGFKVAALNFSIIGIVIGSSFITIICILAANKVPNY